jgi:hypothetical protein
MEALLELPLCEGSNTHDCEHARYRLGGRSATRHAAAVDSASGDALSVRPSSRCPSERGASRLGLWRRGTLASQLAKVVPASLCALALMPGVALAEELTTTSQAASQARALAAEAGDPGATVEVGAGTLPVQATGPSSLAETAYDPTTSYKVLLKGNFTIDGRAPAGFPAPTGEEMELVLDKATGTPILRWLKPANTAKAARAASRGPANAVNATRAGNATRRKSRKVAKVATWGNNCKRVKTNHCYGIANWSMTGSDETYGGEQVLGCEAWQKTTSMYVVDWESDSFIDHEMWCGFKPQGWWVEAGQEAGSRRSCCTLYPFWALEASYGYVETPAVGWTEPADNYNLYRIESIPQWNEGAWCFYYGEAQAACYPYFPTYSNNLQVGTELATEDWPDSEEWTVAYYTGANGSGIHHWNRAEDKDITNSGGPNGVTCIKENPEYPAPGDIVAWVC